VIELELHANSPLICGEGTLREVAAIARKETAWPHVFSSWEKRSLRVQ